MRTTSPTRRRFRPPNRPAVLAFPAAQVTLRMSCTATWPSTRPVMACHCRTLSLMRRRRQPPPDQQPVTSRRPSRRSISRCTLRIRVPSDRLTCLGIRSSRRIQPAWSRPRTVTTCNSSRRSTTARPRPQHSRCTRSRCTHRTYIRTTRSTLSRIWRARTVALRDRREECRDTLARTCLRRHRTNLATTFRTYLPISSTIPSPRSRLRRPTLRQEQVPSRRSKRRRLKSPIPSRLLAPRHLIEELAPIERGGRVAATSMAGHSHLTRRARAALGPLPTPQVISRDLHSAQLPYHRISSSSRTRGLGPTRWSGGMRLDRPTRRVCCRCRSAAVFHRRRSCRRRRWDRTPDCRRPRSQRPLDLDGFHPELVAAGVARIFPDLRHTRCTLYGTSNVPSRSEA